jgi:hypothetical protein
MFSTTVELPYPKRESGQLWNSPWGKKWEPSLYNDAMPSAVGGSLLLIAVVASAALAQTPQPFPRPGSPQQQAPPRPSAPTQPPRATSPPAVAPAPVPASPASTAADEPTAATLGFPLYPTAQYLASYDAGRGQRFYLFGATAPYAELVAYYRAQLKEKGDEVYTQPGTYMFQIGRFREETMAFPPGVTIKDWTWGGSQGYPNPKRGVEPARFPTVIMIVPAPPAAAPAR